ncbi:MAG: diacylglycerol kinase family protein [Opitutaceae bacterium]|nr:diacylglycerol kinase family protein [Opitutaceae bacterium]
MHVTVVLNEKAGTLLASGNGSPFSLDALRSAFSEAGIIARIEVCPPGAVQERIRQVVAARNGTDAIVVGGGDGTLSCAAGILIDTAMPLGVLPLGTLNHFAKDLEIPAELDACVRIIRDGELRAVDVAEVNGHVFINNCSVGAYPAAVRRRDALRRMHGFGKWRAMALASLEVLRNLRRLHVHIDANGEPLIRRTPFVLVSNNRYSGQIFSRQMRPRLDEGQLCTYVTRAHRIAPLLRLAWRALTAGLDRVDELEILAGEHVTLTLREIAPAVATDGEVFNVTSPLLFRTRARALRVIAPPPKKP